MLPVLIEKSEARARMPELGQIMRKIPSFRKGEMRIQKPKRCKVVQVHPGHLWYMVRYEDGMLECFRLLGEKEEEEEEKAKAGKTAGGKSKK